MHQLQTPLNSRKKFRPYRLLTEQEAISARRKKTFLKALVLAVLACAAYAHGYFYYNSYFEKTTDAQLMTESSALSSKVDGKVAKVLVKEGQVVTAGTPLAQLEPAAFQAELDRREANLKKSEDRLSGGKTYLERLQKQAADGGNSEREKYDGARKWYYKLQSKTQELRDEVTQAREQLKATTILAPSDGHVAKKITEPGTLVHKGQPLFEFAGSKEPWVIANFKHSQLEKISVGQKVKFNVDGVERSFLGRVESMTLKPEPVARNRFERLVSFFSSVEPKASLRVAVDSKSIGKDGHLLKNSAAALVQVYIR